MYGFFWPYVASEATTNYKTLDKHKMYWSCFNNVLFALKKILSNPPLVAMCLGFLVGLIKPLQELFFADESFLTPLISSINVLGQGAVPLSCFVVAGMYYYAIFH